MIYGTMFRLILSFAAPGKDSRNDNDVRYSLDLQRARKCTERG